MGLAHKFDIKTRSVHNSRKYTDEVLRASKGIWKRLT